MAAMSKCLNVQIIYYKLACKGKQTLVDLLVVESMLHLTTLWSIIPCSKKVPLTDLGGW